MRKSRKLKIVYCIWTFDDFDLIQIYLPSFEFQQRSILLWIIWITFALKVILITASTISILRNDNSSFIFYLIIKKKFICELNAEYIYFHSNILQEKLNLIPSIKEEIVIFFHASFWYAYLILQWWEMICYKCHNFDPSEYHESNSCEFSNY